MNIQFKEVINKIQIVLILFLVFNCESNSVSKNVDILGEVNSLFEDSRIKVSCNLKEINNTSIILFLQFKDSFIEHEEFQRLVFAYLIGEMEESFKSIEHLVIKFQIEKSDRNLMKQISYDKILLNNIYKQYKDDIVSSKIIEYIVQKLDPQDIILFDAFLDTVRKNYIKYGNGEITDKTFIGAITGFSKSCSEKKHTVEHFSYFNLYNSIKFLMQNNEIELPLSKENLSRLEGVLSDFFSICGEDTSSWQ